MRIAADTNLLVRFIINDDTAQAAIAFKILTRAELLVVSLPCLCELAWVLNSVYRLPRDQIATAIRTLVDSSNVAADMPAVEAGLLVHELGGDFADGVIASVGHALGGDLFVSFDRKAVTLAGRIGLDARHANELA